jgi:hypothetical protein
MSNYRGISLDKYVDNLHIRGNDVYSYTTIVARIDGSKLHELGKWSSTTSKHVNYVAKYYGLTKVEDWKK